GGLRLGGREEGDDRGHREHGAHPDRGDDRPGREPADQALLLRLLVVVVVVDVGGVGGLPVGLTAGLTGVLTAGLLCDLPARGHRGGLGGGRRFRPAGPTGLAQAVQAGQHGGGLTVGPAAPGAFPSRALVAGALATGGLTAHRRVPVRRRGRRAGALVGPGATGRRPRRAARRRPPAGAGGAISGTAWVG